MRIRGSDDGLSCDGATSQNLSDDMHLTFCCRPYLHMYKHSNEIEEVAVVNLTGVNLESNPEMEALLGVRAHFLSL